MSLGAAALVGGASAPFLFVTFAYGRAFRVILYGTVITAFVSFVMIAFVMFLLIKAYNTMTKPDADDDARETPLHEQPRAAREEHCGDEGEQDRHDAPASSRIAPSSPKAS